MSQHNCYKYCQSQGCRHIERIHISYTSVSLSPPAHTTTPLRRRRVVALRVHAVHPIRFPPPLFAQSSPRSLLFLSPRPPRPPQPIFEPREYSENSHSTVHSPLFAVPAPVDLQGFARTMPYHLHSARWRVEGVGGGGCAGGRLASKALLRLSESFNFFISVAACQSKPVEA